ncbi:MAG: UvrD-helicase domain-containing protein [Candidatus Izemoplasmatales bacterium]
MNYTNKQIQAINHEGQNILVSASAGSGKTGVLKARVIRKITSGVDIDKLIVLTFTKAAAEEMKSRIINDLETLKLEEQIIKLDNAIISTFDAFTLRLVNEYHYLLDLPSDITISDKVLIDIESKAILEELIKEYYLENKPEFNSLIKLLFSSNDDFLEKAIVTVAKGLKKVPNYNKIISDYDKFLSDEFLQVAYYDYIAYLRSDIVKIYQKFMIYFNDNLNVYDSKCDEYLHQVKLVYQTIIEEEDPDEFIKKIKNYAFPRKPSKPKNIDDYLEADPYKGLLKKIKTELDENLIEGYLFDKERFLETKPRVMLILEMANKYLKRLNKVQKQKALYSYDDIMTFAIKLFEEYPDVKKKYKENINEILIDEYQDTNDLQDYFISLIANDNIFMVGDVKQSIYRFRDANPKNFMRIFSDYESHDLGKAIRLKENFRSNKYLLEVVNNLFVKVMSKTMGGVNYSNNHQLVSGFSDDYGLNEKNRPLLEHYYDPKLIQEKYQELSKEEIEAHILAKDIVKKIKARQPIFTGKGFKSIDYQDITILVDRKTSFAKYKKVLSEYKIPIEVYSDEEFVETEEIIFLFQFLLLIESFRNEAYFKKYFKQAFYSVARSFVYQINDKEILELLVNENFDSISDIKNIDNYKSLKVIKNQVLTILELVDILPNYKVIDNIYKITNIYEKIAEIENPEAKESKLDYFRELIFNQKEKDFNDLINYLEFINESHDLDIEYNETKANVNAVKLMSIHKSKGLQFPIVYLIGLNKKFNLTENKEIFNFSSDYGVLTHSYTEGFHRNFLENLYLRQIQNEDDSEKVRLLYVALTRAKEEINLILEAIDDFKFKNLTYNKYQEMLYDGLDLEPYDIITDLVIPKVKETSETKTTNEKIIHADFNFETEKVEQKSYSKTTNEFFSDETIKAIEYGDEIHKLLEDIDYNNLEETLKSLPKNIQSSIIYLSNSEVFNSFKKPEFFQEYEFIEKTKSNYKTGIIDLLVIDIDKAYIFDYKLKNISDEAYTKQIQAYKDYLKTQIDLPITGYLYSLLDKDLKRIV